MGAEEAQLKTTAAHLETHGLAEPVELKSLELLPLNGFKRSLMVLLRENPNTKTRHAIVHRLLRARIEGEAICLSRKQIKQQLRGEAETCTVLMRLKELCRHCCPEQRWLLRLVQEVHLDSIRNTFRTLMLRYRIEDLHLIYHQLTEGHARMQADALELLENLVDSGLRPEVERIVGHYFDPPAQDFYKHSSDIEAELRILLGHPNLWLALMGVLLFTHVGIQSLAHDLQLLKMKSIPILSNAARFALGEHEKSSAEQDGTTERTVAAI